MIVRMAKRYLDEPQEAINEIMKNNINCKVAIILAEYFSGTIKRQLC